MSYYPLISIMPKTTSNLLLDVYTNAAVAYSLRKLRTAYTGNCIRVRRSSDNAEQDIAFVNDDLDTQTMLDFVGYNLWTYSEDISQAVYSNSRSTETINSITAPDGNLTGGKVIEDLTLGEHGLNRNTTNILNATNYNISAYFKQGERTKIKIYSNISGTTQSCDLDLTNGNITNNGFANTPTVTAEANGWYRFSVTITSGLTSATFPFQFRTFNASNQLSYTGDGTSGCYVWGYQLSQTSSVKTYQKTVATAGGAGFITTWYDQSGNGNDLTRTSAVNQPYIVSAGSLVIDNGTPAVRFDGTNDSLVTTATFTQSQPITSFGLFKVATNKNYVPVYGFGSSGSISLVDVTQYSVNSLRIGATGGSGSNFEVNHILNKSINLNTYYIASALYNTPNFSFTLNNNISTGTSGVNTLSLSSNNFSIGNQFAYGYTDATVKEVVVYFGNQSANITNIESNINTFYTVF